MLHIGVIGRQLDDIGVLLDAGALVNSIGDLGFTPLHYAAMKGNMEIAQKLLTHGADRDLRNEFGQTPADVAELGQHHGLAKFLRHWEAGFE